MASLRAYRLKKNRDFQRIYKRGRSVAGKYLVLVHTRSNDLKAGFCVGKRVGNSVVRNRVKRLMREAFRASVLGIKNARIVIIARTAAANASYSDIKNSMDTLLNKAGLMKEEKTE